MYDVTTEPNINEFTERFWKIIEKRLGCRVPVYVKNILKLRGFENAASIKTLSNADYKAFETFARTKMEKYIPSTSHRADYFHMFTNEPHEFEILPGHVRLLNEIVDFIKDTTASHDFTLFDPDFQFENTDNSIGQSQDLLKSNEKLNYELANSFDHPIGRSPVKSDGTSNYELVNSVNNSIGRSQQLLKSNGKDYYESASSVNNSKERCQELFKSNEKFERQFGVLKPLGMSQDLFRSNKKVHELSYSDHNMLRRSKSNDIEFGRKKYTNFEQLQQRQSEFELIQALLQNSTNLDSYRSGENCCVSHVNSLSDFYIQMESDADVLEKLADYLLDESKFEVLTDIKDGNVCAAKFMGDEKWYRAQIRLHTAGNTEVFFIDYGNLSLTNELRVIPPEIANAPSLAKYCSMVKPKDMQYWSDNAEQRFMELNDNETIFMVEVISPGEKSIVNLFVNQKSFLEEISCLSAKNSLSSLKSTLQSKSDAVVASESIRALIVYGLPNQFYIHLESNLTKVEQLWDSMQAASTWPIFEKPAVDQMCAALLKGNYYRARILLLVDEGAIVHCVDYGNKSISTDLRQLPETLHNIPPMAVLCSLETDNGIFSQQMVEEFENLSRKKLFEIKYLSENSVPAIVQIFENGVQFMDKPTIISEPKESSAKSMYEVHIAEKILSSHSQIHLDRDMDEVNTAVIETKDYKKTAVFDESENFIDDTKTFSTATTLEEQKQGEDYQREKASASDGVSFPAVCEAQCNKLTISGEQMLNRPKDIPFPKYIEPIQLNDGDDIVIRYVESASVFYVQKTKNIPYYNDMVDKLMQYCLTAPSLKTFETGMACAAIYRLDSEWYRAQIEEINGKDALIRFVDFGVVLPTETINLKEISKAFMLYPKQAVRCCLLGFDTLQSSCTSSDRMELLAENALGERRNFRVKIYGHVNDSILVNLTDELETPPLDLSKRMLQLSLPHDTYRSYKWKTVRQGQTSRELINEAVHPPVHTYSRIQNDINSSKFACKPVFSSDNEQNTSINSLTNHQNHTNSDIESLPRNNGRDSKFCKNQDYVNQSYDSRHETLSSVDVIDTNTQIPFEEIIINNSEEVILTWCFSPLEFYVSTTKHEADFTRNMTTIHQFYKDKSPVTKKIEIGSFVIAKYSKDNQFHRAEIIDYNEKLNKYKALLIDVGALTILDAFDIYEMDKRFAKFNRRAILCSLHGVALRASRFHIESAIEKYFLNKKLICKFIKRKGDKFYVDIDAEGTDVKEALIESDYLSVLSEEIEIERLVGQTVMAKVVSIKGWSSLQLVIFGCETIFEASCKDLKLYSEPKQLEDLPMQVNIPVRIDSLLVGQTFSVIPLIENFGAPPSSPICKLPFFCSKFKVFVTYWETHNVAYVQGINSDSFEQSVLTRLFEYYNSYGDGLQEFLPETLCAVKSADENWYRAEIICAAETEVKVRYFDYGNCEIIPKKLVKRLESQFLETPALAIKVYLLLKELDGDQEISIDEIDKLTSHTSLDLTVLEHYAQHWIVDMFQEGASITSFIKTATGCETLLLDEFKEQLDAITISENLIPQLKSSGHNHQAEAQSKLKLVDAEMSTILRNTQLDCHDISKTKACISHVDRPDRFYLQVLSESVELKLNLLQENIQMAAPSLPPLEDFSVGTRCIAQYLFDGQWYRGVIIDSDSKITSILFIDYGNTDTITDTSLIKSTNETFDEIPAYAIPCALPLEPKNRNKWSEESCELLKNFVNDKVEFEYVCKGKDNNLVKLYDGERDIMQELIQNGYAIKLDTIRSGEKCYFSHVNSISDFYIQMESDSDGLRKLADYLLDESKFDVLTDIQNGTVCVAKFMEDGLWYRAIIKSHTDDNTEVFFIDYGNSSSTNELRVIPPEIAYVPSLAKHCSIVKPEDIQIWSENAENRFVELSFSEDILMVDVISPGKKSIVDLFVNEKSILEEVSNLCDYTSETFKALIVYGSPALFYIQLERNVSKLYQICDLLEPATTWPVLDKIVVGQMCAAIFDGVYYRAKISSVNEEDVTVYFIDYGNKSISTDLRILPVILQITEPLAIKCSLESNNGIYSPQLVERFEKLSRDDFFEMKFVSKNSSPIIIQLFENGVLFPDMSIVDPTQNGHVMAEPNNSMVRESINEAIAIMSSP